MNYLKALGVLRLVAEQKDHNAKGCWRDGVFVLQSNLDENTLLRFFIKEYCPTPIVVPWSGNDFFDVNHKGNCGPFRKTPTSSTIIEAFLAMRCSRLANYRKAISDSLHILTQCGQFKKFNPQKKKDLKLKAQFIARLRSFAMDDVVCWVDTCAVLTDEKPFFSAILGSGGGNDGNTHFSDNFMQNLWEVLPDFDVQRSKNQNSIASSSSTLSSALFGSPCTDLVPNRTSSLYDSGASGGPNAGQGFERISLGNPWTFILCLEGTILLAGSLTRRQGSMVSGVPAFPFQVQLTPTSTDSGINKESIGKEIWLPIWKRWVDRNEIEVLFSEGRGSVGRRDASHGLDFARAATNLGIDRGIDAFQRYAIVKGRVGGDNYNTAASFGRFDVRARPDVDLIREIDPWLDRFRQVSADEKSPPRYKSALRQIDAAIFDFCQFGGSNRFAEILCALGQAEQDLAVTSGRVGRNKTIVRPLAGLSPSWLRAANDESLEFHVALALSGIWDHERRTGPFRSNIEAVTWSGHSDWKGNTSWATNQKSVVWNSSDLCANLTAVLERRLLDGGRMGCTGLPFTYRRGASLEAISAFVAGELDDMRITELLWGMMLIDHAKPYPELPHVVTEAPPLPRAFALLKLLFLPYRIETRVGEIQVKPEARILALLRAGRTGEACSIAVRRLRASGFTPMPHSRNIHRDNEWQDAVSGFDPHRLAAALLIPINHYNTRQLVWLITRPKEVSQEDTS